jgi:hypothetical protein
MLEDPFRFRGEWKVMTAIVPAARRFELNETAEFDVGR